MNKKYNYLPITYNSGSDDIFYYSFIRETIDGHFPVTDPHTLENKGKKSRLISYAITFLLGGLSGVLTNNIKHAVYINNYILPFFNFILMYYLCFIISKNKNYSILVSVLIIIFLPMLRLYFPFIDIVDGVDYIKNSTSLTPFSRISVMISNLWIVGFAITFYYYILFNKGKLFYLLLLLLGLSSYVYFTTSIILYSITFFSILMFWSHKDLRFKLILILFYALILSSYSIYIVFYEIFYQSSYYIDSLSGMSTGLFKNINDLYYKTNYLSIKGTILFLLIIINGIILFSFSREDLKKPNGSIIFGCISIFFLFYFTLGEEFVHRLLVRGFLPLYTILSFGIMFTTIKYFTKKMNNKSSIAFYNISKLCIKHIHIIIFGMLILGFLFQNRGIKTNELIQHDNRNYQSMFDWLKQNTQKDEVVLAFDSELLILIPIYTHLNIYLPGKMMSVTNEIERKQRLFDTLKYLNIPPDVYKNILFSINNPGITKNNSLVNSNNKILNYILFHIQYVGKKIPIELINKLYTEYKIYWNEQNSLSFKAHYIIVSNYNLFLQDNYSFNIFFNEEKLLYQSDNFSIYNI